MNSKTLLGFAAGISVGAVLGILFAPDKGSGTREKIAGKANDLSESARGIVCDILEKVKDYVKAGKADLERGITDSGVNIENSPTH